MYFKRHIDSVLTEWRNEPDRKPLFLRGARQVGKSSAVRQLAKQFDYFIEINFEEQPKAHKIFDKNLTPAEICENIVAIYNIPVIEGKTLLFFDEVQACLPAISSLRFFFEKMPGLHVLAAGSLLEFALGQLPSFGVGRVRSVFMYPFSFNEFLLATGNDLLLGAKERANHQHPLNTAVHEKLLGLFRKFLVLGGMPEVVSVYCQTTNLLHCQRVLDDLILSFRDDFAKYKKHVDPLVIAEVYKAVALQTGSKFVYSKASQSISHYYSKAAINLLKMAGLVIPVTHTDANGLPLGAEQDLRKQKIYYNDTGLLQRELGLNTGEILLAENFDSINKGAIAEQAVGLEMLKNCSPFTRAELFYWQREIPSSNAEVDYIIQLGQTIVPVEVKASSKGSMQSLHQFIARKKCQFGIRISDENYGQYEKIKVYPVYAVAELLKLQI
jgi:hypothetical protein